jgi:hypothetical protein
MEIQFTVGVTGSQTTLNLTRHLISPLKGPGVCVCSSLWLLFSIGMTCMRLITDSHHRLLINDKRTQVIISYKKKKTHREWCNCCLLYAFTDVALDVSDQTPRTWRNVWFRAVNWIKVYINYATSATCTLSVLSIGRRKASFTPSIATLVT